MTGLKVIVFSDSHGDLNNMITVVQREMPDLVLHLGDYWGDAEELSWMCPELTIEQVPGNCDYQPDAPLERTLELEGCRLTVCHGHSRHVKQGYQELTHLGQDTEAAIVLCGHTHCVHYEKRGRLHVLNPGTVRGNPPTYGILHLEQGKIEGKIKRVFSEEDIVCFC